MTHICHSNDVDHRGYFNVDDWIEKIIDLFVEDPYIEKLSQYEPHEGLQKDFPNMSHPYMLSKINLHSVNGNAHVIKERLDTIISMYDNYLLRDLR